MTLAGAHAPLGADHGRRAGSGSAACIGILAGGGRLPLLLAESLTARGVGVHIIGLAGEADVAIAAFDHSWVRWGEIGRMLATLRQQGCRELVIAGAVRRPDLWKLRPDAGLIRNLPQLARLLVGGDDGVLTSVVRFFERRGLSVRGAHEVAPELLAAAGRIGEVALAPMEEDDARRGFAVRRALQAVDAGQAVVVANGRVLAIEGVEGTDAMLQRLAAVAGGSAKRSGVLAKGPKPGQELRVDMPAIGPRTILNACAAGLAGVVVEAGAVLLLDRAQMLKVADEEGCAVHGLVQAFPARTAPPPARRGRVIGRYRPKHRDRRDLELGVTALAALAGVGVHGAVIVARAHVLAIEPGDGAAAMLQRVATLRQWGLSGRRRTGVFVCAAEAAACGGIDTLFAHASAQRLAGVVVVGAGRAIEPYELAARLADEFEIFLVVCEEAQPP